MRNRLLNMLPDADLDALRPHLAPMRLPRGAAIDLPGDPIRHAHFIEEGFVSILIDVGEQESEVGLVGREGMIGIPAVLGSDINDYRAVVRQEGHALRITVEAFRDVVATRRAVGALVLRFMQAGVTQLAHTSFASAHMTIPQRLARWLLMAHDRIDGDTLTVTHDILAVALGVRRAGVTMALHELEGEHAIRSRHRVVTILDRDMLMAHAGGAYGPAERAYHALLGASERGP